MHRSGVCSPLMHERRAQGIGEGALMVHLASEHKTGIQAGRQNRCLPLPGFAAPSTDAAHHDGATFRSYALLQCQKRFRQRWKGGLSSGHILSG